MEDEIAKYGSEAVLKKIMADRKPGPASLPKENPFAISADAKLPLWLSQDDLKYYSTKFDQTGFTGGLNYYRALDLYVPVTPNNVIISHYCSVILPHNLAQIVHLKSGYSWCAIVGLQLIRNWLQHIRCWLYRN